MYDALSLRDLPLMLERLRAQYPDVSLDAMPPLGEIDPVLESIARWIVQAGAAG